MKIDVNEDNDGGYDDDHNIIGYCTLLMANFADGNKISGRNNLWFQRFNMYPFFVDNNDDDDNG